MGVMEIDYDYINVVLSKLNYTVSAILSFFTYILKYMNTFVVMETNHVVLGKLYCKIRIFSFKTNNTQNYLLHKGALFLCCIYVFLAIRSSTISKMTKEKALIQCFREMAAIIHSKDCHPILLRLAWSDAGTYDQSIKNWPQCGGATGNRNTLQRFKYHSSYSFYFLYMTMLYR